jgi:hypothetical protein
MAHEKFELGSAENSFLQRLMQELSPEERARLKQKTAEGLLSNELERLRASHQFGISSDDMDMFMQNVQRMERLHRGNAMSSYDMRGTFKTPSGETQINSKKGCYIATAVYGSFEHPNVLLLRRFRDQHLEESMVGRCLCACYYWASPWLAQGLFSKGAPRSAMRKVLDGVCRILD